MFCSFGCREAHPLVQAGIDMLLTFEGGVGHVHNAQPGRQSPCDIICYTFSCSGKCPCDIICYTLSCSGECPCDIICCRLSLYWRVSLWHYLLHLILYWRVFLRHYLWHYLLHLIPSIPVTLSVADYPCTGIWPFFNLFVHLSLCLFSFQWIPGGKHLFLLVKHHFQFFAHPWFVVRKYLTCCFGDHRIQHSQI